MARTPTAVSRTGPPGPPPAGRSSPAGIRRTWAVLVGLLLSGAVCAGLLAGGAPAAASVHRAISTASGQASGAAGTEQRQRTPSRRTHSQSARADRAVQAARTAQAARSVQAPRPAVHVVRAAHPSAAKSVGGNRAPPTAGRGTSHGSGTAHPVPWAVSTDRPDPYVRAGGISTDSDRTGHAPAALGGTGVRAPPGPHAA